MSQRGGIDARGVPKSRGGGAVDRDVNKSYITARSVPKLPGDLYGSDLPKSEVDKIGIRGIPLPPRDDMCGGSTSHKSKREDMCGGSAQNFPKESEGVGMRLGPGGAVGGVGKAQQTIIKQAGLAKVLPLTSKGAGPRIVKTEEEIASSKLTAIGGGRGMLSWSAIAAKGNMGGKSVIEVGEGKSKGGRGIVPVSQKKASSMIVSQQDTPKDNWGSVEPFSYIGVSKLSCYPCSLWIEGFNLLQAQRFYTKGSHGKWYVPWIMPRIENDQVGQYIVKRILEKYIQTLRREKRLRSASDSTADSQDTTDSAWNPSKLDDLRDDLLAENP